MNDFFKRQRQSIRLKFVAPLMFIEWILRPRFHRAEICRRVQLRRCCLHSWSHRHWQLLLVICGLSRLRPRRWHWMTVTNLEALTADNCVTSRRRWSRFTLRSEIVSCWLGKEKLIWGNFGDWHRKWQKQNNLMKFLTGRNWTPTESWVMFLHKIFIKFFELQKLPLAVTKACNLKIPKTKHTKKFTCEWKNMKGPPNKRNKCALETS